MMAFMAGFFFGILFMAIIFINHARKNDLTVIDGHVRWVNRNDRMTMDYTELVNKYGYKRK